MIPVPADPSKYSASELVRACALHSPASLAELSETEDGRGVCCCEKGGGGVGEGVG